MIRMPQPPSRTYYGNLTDGKIRFTLTPSSSILLNSSHPFTVYDANARVVNAQTYWRGVTSPTGQYIQTTINPIGPYMVYQDPSGEGIAYNLPSYSNGASTSSSPDSIFFARYQSIQSQAQCAIDTSPVPTTWRNDEQLQFCTPYSGDLRQPFTGIANNAFLFPAMWTTWEIEADHDDWTNKNNFDIDENELALQVTFCMLHRQPHRKQVTQINAPCIVELVLVIYHCLDKSGVVGTHVVIVLLLIHSRGRS